MTQRVQRGNSSFIDDFLFISLYDFLFIDDLQSFEASNLLPLCTRCIAPDPSALPYFITIVFSRCLPYLPRFSSSSLPIAF